MINCLIDILTDDTSLENFFWFPIKDVVYIII